MIIDDIENLWIANKDCFKDKMQSWLQKIDITQRSAAEMRQHFHQWRPLYAYVRAGGRNHKSAFVFSLRFLGQEVATLLVERKEVCLNIDEKTARTNQRFFPDLKIPVAKYPWRGKEARYFRKYFSLLNQNPLIKLHSPEHRIESIIIREMFSKKRTKFGGTFSGIQPVTIAGFPLQFPLPISGCSGKPLPTNGHMDILARRRKAGRVCLSIWELKAPRKYKDTLCELYIYSVTLLKMLRDPDFGQRWYKVFGFSGKIPSRLCIEGVVAITSDQKAKLSKEISRCDLKREIGNDEIDFFVAYYDENTLNINFEKI